MAKVSQARDYLYNRDPKVRKFVSLELGKLAAYRPVNAQVQQAIEMLGQLSRDFEASVRQAAVESLGTIPSQWVIPFLQMALRDADAEVVKTASAALERYKFYPARHPHSKTVKKPQQKPKR